MRLHGATFEGDITMALIKCSECGYEVSDKATACPKCGNPVATARDVAATGRPLTTTQATAKRFKGQQLLAAGLCAVGIILLVSGGEGGVWGTLLLVAGFAWFLLARVIAWWHHG
jgi:predicted nucleic-acid-binding Zn-ribbon protein